MRKIMTIMMTVLLLIGGCASSGNDIFREKIVPDFETVLKCDEAVYSAYESAIEAAKLFAENPTEENKQSFFDAAQNSSNVIKDNSTVQSSLSDADYKEMEKLNLSEADYKYLFESYPASMANLDDWADVTESVDTTGDYEALAHAITLRETKLELERVYMAYASMDWVVNMDEESVRYFEEVMRRYPSVMPEEYEWLTDEEEIISVLDEKMSGIQNKINEEQIYSNDQLNELREEESQNK